MHKPQLEVDPHVLTSYNLEGFLQIKMYLVILPCDLTLWSQFMLPDTLASGIHYDCTTFTVQTTVVIINYNCNKSIVQAKN